MVLLLAPLVRWYCSSDPLRVPKEIFAWGVYNARRARLDVSMTGNLETVAIILAGEFATNGLSRPQFRRLIRLARVLGVTVDDLIEAAA